MLLTCQIGFEPLLARELAELRGAVVVEKGSGWVRIERGPDPLRVDPVDPTRLVPADPAAATAEKPEHPERHSPDLPRLAFAHLSIIDPVEVRADSVNALAARTLEIFLASVRNERIEKTWPNVWLGPPDVVGLGRRIGAVEATFAELLKKKVARIGRMAVAEVPRGAAAQLVRGLFVFFADFGRILLGREAFVHGQRRMADDDLAPSRSYLKLEEAYLILGREPQHGDTVCDLGAAPGGWSYSAAKRGARVIAIDNGPLKGGALDHPLIEHRREDAFGFQPVRLPPGGVAAGAAFEWLLCDLVEEPHHVLRHIVEPWLGNGYCRRFVVNLKFGRVDPIALLQQLEGTGSPLALHAPEYRIRHLYHDREELTLVGAVTRS